MWAPVWGEEGNVGSKDRLWAGSSLNLYKVKEIHPNQCPEGKPELNCGIL